MQEFIHVIFKPAVVLLLIASIHQTACVSPTPALESGATQTLVIDASALLNPSATLHIAEASSSIFVASSAGCGGNFTNSTGQLSPPNYPLDIPSAAYCTWRITVRPNSRVSLLFNFLVLEGTVGCVKDYLEVWDGPAGSLSKLKEYCGSLKKPERLVTNTNEVEVRFRSNSTLPRRGFLVTYSTFTGCNHTLTNDSGVIETPYYPDSYPLNIECAYRIQVPAGQLVSLALEFLDLAYSSDCSEDALEVWNGPMASSSLIGRYCGYLFGRWLRSNDSELSLRFKSNMAETRRGFRLIYRAVQSACNSTLNNTRGTIASPQRAGTKCSWTIQAPPDHVISLLFDRFYLKYTDGCSRDYLVIKDSSSVAGRYCGYQKSELVYSKSDTVMLDYVSTSGIDNVGFQIHYEAVKLQCGGYLNNSRGSFQSPLFPKNYPSNVKCAWQIEQPAGYRVNVVFDEFDVEFSVNCSRDYLEVFDGADNTSQSLGRYCGVKKSTNHVMSSGNAIYVEFVSNERVSRGGFKVSYTGIKTDCPRNFTNTSGIIQSPNYPDFYPNSYNCQWLISYALGYQIYLTFTSFELDYTARCSGDYVELFDGSGQNVTSKGKYCGFLVKRYPLVSSGNEMVIKLHTDGGGASRGFVFSYEVDGTGLAPPPRTPSTSEVQQAVEVTFYNLTTAQWITNRDILFKKLIGNATTIYCAENQELCRITIADRSSTFTVHQVHLVPNFPTPAGQTINLIVVFYLLYPQGASLDPRWNSTALPQNALLKSMNTSADYISSAFGLTIISITPYSLSTPTPNATTTSPPPIFEETSQSNFALVIGLSVIFGFLLVFAAVALSCYIWRKKNHGKFLVSRAITPIEFGDEVELKTSKARKVPPALRQRVSSTSSLKVVDLEDDLK